jgi:SH3 domain-containing YSC84-like protein 1
MQRLKGFVSAMGTLVLVVLVTAGCASTTPEEKAAERKTLTDLVAGSAETVTAFRTGEDAATVNALLANGKGALVFPKITRAALLGGGSGGFGVLVGQNERHQWSDPAFMSHGAATFGLQAGVDTASVLAIINNEKTLKDIAEGRASFGGSASVVTGSGGTEQLSSLTTSDVVIFTRSLGGAYAGVNLRGSVIDPANDKNELFYGRPVTATDVVVHRAVSSPDAAVLQQALAK